ncbi:MAG TPA: M56 family metallopeptidase [Longimicrobiaceae bacterium]|nr:M56 family metallopeptidase [Longimicrobiaceae bacterium]
MTAAWMGYALAVSLLAALAALALERALAAFARPTRWPWLAALLVSAALPVAAAIAVEAGSRPAPLLPKRVAGPAVTVGTPAAPLEVRPRRAGPSAAALDVPLLAGWAAASAGVLAWLAGAGVLLARRRRRWRADVVDGAPVLVAPDAGPAVVGFVRGAVVLPEWVVREADPAVRELMIAHEQEHLRAGDPRLLLAALAAVALAPWNPALWWQLRRLRLAVEVDCDARVLRRRGDVHAYGRLLLEVGRRASGGMGLAAAAFSEPVSFLERRIRIMTRHRVRASRLHAAVLGGAAVLLVVGACETPHPTSVTPIGTVDALLREPDAEGEVPVAPEKVRELVRQHFPDVLARGLEEGSSLSFLVDGKGRVLEARVIAGVPRTIHALPRDSRPRDAPPTGPARVAIRTSVGRAAGRQVGRLERVDPNAIASIEVSRLKPGELGPSEVRVVLVQLKDGFVEAPPSSLPMRRMQDGGARPAPVQAAAVRAALERHHPSALRAGIPADRPIWFVVDPSGQVVRTGQFPVEPFDGGWADAIEDVEVIKGRSLGLDEASGVLWFRLKR